MSKEQVVCPVENEPLQLSSSAYAAKLKKKPFLKQCLHHVSFFIKRKIIRPVYHWYPVKYCCFSFDAWLHKRHTPILHFHWVNKVASPAQKKLCIFCHFDPNNQVDAYVFYYLNALHEAGCDIVFVSTSQAIDQKSMARLKMLCQHIVIKDNLGRDLIAYKVGLGLVEEVAQYDKVIFANDSVYGPLFDIRQAIHYGDDKNLDIWGITDSQEYHYHLQSYFLVFKKDVVLSEAFRQFWAQVYPLSNKSNIVQFYEVGLSQYFLKQGYRLGALVAYKAIKQSLRENVFHLPEKQLHHFEAFMQRPENPSYYFWWYGIKYFQCPIIKRDLLSRNAEKINLSGWSCILGNYTTYNAGLIAAHLERLGRARFIC